MPIVVQCACGKRLQAKDHFAGKRVKCPGCGQGLEVPAPEPEPDVLQMVEVPPEEPAAPPEPSYGLSPESEETPPEPEPEPKPKRSRKVKRAAPPTLQTSARSYVYFLLLVALLPLVLSVFLRNREGVDERLMRTLEHSLSNDEVVQRLEKLKSEDHVGLDEVIAAMPGGKIEGAHLPRKTWRHLVYAALSAIVFLGLILAIFPRGWDRFWSVYLVGFITGTAGILLLLLVQRIAIATDGVWMHGRGVLTAIFYVFKLIGFSYRSAFDPDSSFALSFLGFTFGVGLCEELCKAAPVLWHYRRNGALAWQEACLWGMASGVGFGVAEGVFYCADFYNGVFGVDVYLVRFISCVALHAIWSASVALTIHANQGFIQGAEGWAEYALGLLRVLAIVMVMHGLYDTLLKKDLNLLSFGLALASFGWLTWQIERMRRTEREERPVEAETV